MPVHAPPSMRAPTLSPRGISLSGEKKTCEVASALRTRTSNAILPRSHQTQIRSRVGNRCYMQFWPSKPSTYKTRGGSLGAAMREISP
eukprot:1186248-Prorocentrum_minimum.AAC.1